MQRHCFGHLVRVLLAVCVGVGLPNAQWIAADAAVVLASPDGFHALDGCAVHEGSTLGDPHTQCDEACCREKCAANADTCRSFALFRIARRCLLKDRCILPTDATKISYYTTFWRNCSAEEVLQTRGNDTWAVAASPKRKPSGVVSSVRASASVPVLPADVRSRNSERGPREGADTASGVASDAQVERDSGTRIFSSDDASLLAKGAQVERDSGTRIFSSDDASLFAKDARESQHAVHSAASPRHAKYRVRSHSNAEAMERGALLRQDDAAADAAKQLVANSMAGSAFAELQQREAVARSEDGGASHRVVDSPCASGVSLTGATSRSERRPITICAEPRTYLIFCVVVLGGVVVATVVVKLPRRLQVVHSATATAPAPNACCTILRALWSSNVELQWTAITGATNVAAAVVAHWTLASSMNANAGLEVVLCQMFNVLMLDACIAARHCVQGNQRRGQTVCFCLWSLQNHCRFGFYLMVAWWLVRVLGGGAASWISRQSHGDRIPLRTPPAPLRRRHRWHSALVFRSQLHAPFVASRRCAHNRLRYLCRGTWVVSSPG